MTRLVPTRGTLTVVKKFVMAFAVTFIAYKSSAQAPQNKLNYKLQNPESDLSFSGALIQSKPNREEMPQLTLANLTPKYRLENSPNRTSFLGLSLDYSYAWAQYKDQTHSQMDTVTVFVARSSKINRVGSGLDYGLELGLPANQADSNAGFGGSISVPLEISHQFSTQKISFGLQPTFYDYKYKTSTEEGLEYNKKISGLVTFALNSRLTQRLFWKNSVSFFDYENRAGNTYQIYSIASFFRFKILSAVTILGGITSRDRVITTNSVLADDITSVRAGTEWSF